MAGLSKYYNLEAEYKAYLKQLGVKEEELHTLQAQQYRQSIVFPPPPQSIRELAELVNRATNKWFSILYYPSLDVMIISSKSPVMLVATIPEIRKRTGIINHRKFPKALICNNPYYQS